MISELESQIEMKEIIFDLEKIRRLPIEEQRRFVFVLLMQRDLSLLMKLIGLVQNEMDPREFYQAARVSRTFFLFYTLIGKIWEIRNFLKNEGLCSGNDDLPEIFRFIRHKLAFHFESRQDIPEMEEMVKCVLNEMKSFKIWVSPKNYFNTVYQGMDETMINLILRNFGDSEEKKTSKNCSELESFEILLKSTLHWAEIYNDKLNSLSGNYGVNAEEGVTTLLNAPKMLKVRIPLFTS